MKIARFAIVALLVGVALYACSPGVPSSEQIQNQRQEQLNSQAVREVGIPNITNFFEKRQYKTIYELRDRAVATMTYTQDMNGHYHKMCDSIGYGIPYATEFTNPWQADRDGGYTGGAPVAIAQADPNGLYSPSAAEGTWVLCLDPKSRKISPVYSEPRVTVSQFPMPND